MEKNTQKISENQIKVLNGINITTNVISLILLPYLLMMFVFVILLAYEVLALSEKIKSWVLMIGYPFIWCCNSFFKAQYKTLTIIMASNDFKKASRKLFMMTFALVVKTILLVTLILLFIIFI